jgi:glycerol-1-phosphate dehydrogenase [NAD(P)+]
MEDLSMDGNPVTHGHKVAMGTLAATAFTEILFAHVDAPLAPAARRYPTAEERRAEVTAAFAPLAALGSKAGEAAVKTALEKLPTEERAPQFADALRDNWKSIREKVLGRLLPYNDLALLLTRGGCPVIPAAIGLTRTRVIETAWRAQMIRNRYTVLDLAWDLGVFEKVLALMEASGNYLKEL